MKPREIEGWALKVLDSFERGDPIEDARIELKAVFGDPVKIARRLAGHANAARGDDLLWIFGVDEQEGVSGVAAEEFSSWWSRVSSQFKSLAPEVLEVNVRYEGKTVVALFVRTDRVPYLVRNPSYGMPNSGPVELEVPWREMTSTRTARRADLLRLLLPLESLPGIEVISATLIWQGESDPRKGGYERKIPGKCQWDFRLDLYLSPKGEDRLVFPAHKMVVEVTQEETFGIVDFKYYVDRAIDGPVSVMTRTTSEDLVVTGPGRYVVKAYYRQALLETELGANAYARIRLQPVNVDRGIVIRCTLSATQGWSYALQEWSSSTT